MASPHRTLLALLGCLLPWGAVATSPPPPQPQLRVRFQPEQPFGATGLEEVALLTSVDLSWAPGERNLLRTAFLEHVFVTGPDGALVDYGVEVETPEDPIPSGSLGHDERLVLTGLPEGWNTLWIFKRTGLPTPDLIQALLPAARDPLPTWWGETDRYWRLDYLVGRSDPGLSAIAQQVDRTAWGTITYAQVVWSEAMDLTAEGLADSLVLFDADDAPLDCQAGEAPPIDQILFWVWCEGGPAEGVQLLSAPEGLATGAAASFPSLDTLEPLEGWGRQGEVRFAVRRDPVEAPEVQLGIPELPVGSDGYDGSYCGGVGCSAAPGAGAGVGLGLLVLALLARRRRVTGAA